MFYVDVTHMRSTYIYIQTYTIPRRCTHRTIGTQGHPRAPRASNPFCRRQEDIFVFFFGYRARRLRPPHRGRACPVACSKARAASTSSQAFQTRKRFALASQHMCMPAHYCHFKWQCSHQGECRKGRRCPRFCFARNAKGVPRAQKEEVILPGRV